MFLKYLNILSRKPLMSKKRDMAKRKKRFNKLKKRSSPYSLAKIKVVGIGGAGGNAVSRMFGVFPRGVDLIAINTDIQDLEYCQAKKKIYIGKNVTKGLGAGMNPDLGRQAAEESQADIAEALEGADMVFLTAGFGGGTGTGVLPVVAEIAKDLGILTVAIATKPFAFEGYERQRIAEEGAIKTRDKVDTLIIVPNDRIFSVINKNTTLTKAFEAIDEVLKNSVAGIAELIAAPGIINIDFADVRTIIQDAGSAIIGIGSAFGAERAVNAANMAIHSPLLEISIEGARKVLFSVSGHRDLKMSEINDIARMISESADHSAKIIFGAYHDKRLRKGELKVTLMATGFNDSLNLNKETALLPNLFSAATEKEKTIIKTAEESDGIKTAPSQKDKNREKKEKKEEKNDDNVWDIPTFLRRKRK